jgi:hypothetical protein
LERIVHGAQFLVAAAAVGAAVQGGGCVSELSRFCLMKDELDSCLPHHTKMICVTDSCLWSISTAGSGLRSRDWR